MQAETNNGTINLMTIILLLSVIVNVVLIYKFFDTKVSLDHSRMEGVNLQKLNESNFRLVQHLSETLSAQEFQLFIEKMEKSDFIVKKEGSKILIEQYEFQILNDKVTVSKF